MGMTEKRSAAAVPRQSDELPWRGEGADGNLDQARAIATLEGAPKRGAQPLRGSGAFGRGAEAFRKPNEIRIAQIAGDDPVSEPLLLVAPHVAVGIVVENDGNQGDAMVDGGCHLGGREKESAVTEERKHGRI